MPSRFETWLLTVGSASAKADAMSAFRGRRRARAPRARARSEAPWRRRSAAGASFVRKPLAPARNALDDVLVEPNVVSTRTRRRGRRRVASMPSIFTIRMSMSTTSGACASAARIASTRAWAPRSRAAPWTWRFSRPVRWPWRRGSSMIAPTRARAAALPCGGRVPAGACASRRHLQVDGLERGAAAKVLAQAVRLDGEVGHGTILCFAGRPASARGTVRARRLIRSDERDLPDPW